MRFAHWMACVALVGCGGSSADGAQAGKGGSAFDAGSPDNAAGKTASAGKGSTDQPLGGKGGSSSAAQIPRVYPLVRASTPSGLVANEAYRSPGDPSLDIFGDDAGMPAMPGSVTMARVIQERLYSAGPTELLRIISELDARTAGFDTDMTKHPCLAAAPSERTLTFPGGQSFKLQLQCMSEGPGNWMAFGFGPAEASDVDAGPGAADGGKDFYLMQGQDGGMGGAFHIHASGAVEAWITVADSRAPNNSQVLMHLLTDKSDSSTELTFGGSGVGFCSAHLKTGHNYLFIRGKINAPPPPGAPMGHYCDVERTGCFSTTDLNTDLGASASACAPIEAASFRIHSTLDASSDAEANVMPATVYQLFNSKPAGIPAF